MELSELQKEFVSKLSRETRDNRVVWTSLTDITEFRGILVAELGAGYVAELELKPAPASEGPDGRDHELRLKHGESIVHTIVEDPRIADQRIDDKSPEEVFAEFWTAATASAENATDRHLRAVIKLLEDPQTDP